MCFDDAWALIKFTEPALWANDGTSEGAQKGWEARRGAVFQAKSASNSAQAISSNLSHEGQPGEHEEAAKLHETAAAAHRAAAEFHTGEDNPLSGYSPSRERAGHLDTASQHDWTAESHRMAARIPGQGTFEAERSRLGYTPVEPGHRPPPKSFVGEFRSGAIGASGNLGDLHKVSPTEYRVYRKAEYSGKPTHVSRALSPAELARAGGLQVSASNYSRFFKLKPKVQAVANAGQPCGDSFISGDKQCLMGLGGAHLGAGEKGTGDLFKGAEQPFNLSGQTSTDWDRVGREKVKAESNKAEAARIEKEQQGELGQKVSPHEKAWAHGENQPPLDPTLKEYAVRESFKRASAELAAKSVAKKFNGAENYLIGGGVKIQVTPEQITHALYKNGAEEAAKNSKRVKPGMEHIALAGAGDMFKLDPDKLRYYTNRHMGEQSPFK